MTAGDHNFSQILSDWNSEVGVEAFDHVSHHVKFSVSNPLLWNPGNSVKLFSSRSIAQTSANIGKQKHKENRTKINFCLSVKPHFKNIFLPLGISNCEKLYPGFLEKYQRDFFRRLVIVFNEDSKVWYEIFNRITETVRCIICPENREKSVLELSGLTARFMDWYFKNLNCKILL